MQRDAALELLVDALVGSVRAAVARVWTLGPGDLCDGCAMRSECADQTECLHLAKSAGVSRRTDGAFRRFPLGAREVGQVTQTREPIVLNDQVERLGLAEPTWLMVHDVRAFAAVPLTFEGRCIGVAAVFARDLIDDEKLGALMALATLATGIIAGAGNVHPVPVERVAEVAPPHAAPAAAPDATPEPEAIRGVEFLRPFAATERDVLERVLEHTRGRVSGPRGAAALLSLKPTTLHSRMKKLGIARHARTR